MRGAKMCPKHHDWAEQEISRAEEHRCRVLEHENTFVTKKNLQQTGTPSKHRSTSVNTLPFDEIVVLQSPVTCCLDESGKNL